MLCGNLQSVRATSKMNCDDSFCHLSTRQPSLLLVWSREISLGYEDVSAVVCRWMTTLPLVAPFFFANWDWKFCAETSFFPVLCCLGRRDTCFTCLLHENIRSIVLQERNKSEHSIVTNRQTFDCNESLTITWLRGRCTSTCHPYSFRCYPLHGFVAQLWAFESVAFGDEPLCAEPPRTLQSVAHLLQMRYTRCCVTQKPQLKVNRLLSFFFKHTWALTLKGPNSSEPRDEKHFSIRWKKKKIMANVWIDCFAHLELLVNAAQCWEPAALSRWRCLWRFARDTFACHHLPGMRVPFH